ncbi:tetratricopeptide repeat protein [Lichenicoccus sp.]|uniref:tetratricopeptide repeat protein n=1 Tax=Lichenicoccus sp. TaxID=2781899 RepID=UPI003D0A19EC
MHPKSPTAEEVLRQAWAGIAAATDAAGRLFGNACRLLRVADPAAAALLPQLEAFPSYVPGWLVLAALLRDRAQPAAALVACTRVLDVEPDHRDALYIAAHCQRALGRDEAALASLERAVAIDRMFAEGWYSLALLRQDRQQPGAAADAYRQVLQASPTHHEAALNLGVALQELGELEPALDAYALAYRLRAESFGRIAQSLVSGRVGALWLDPARLRQRLADA